MRVSVITVCYQAAAGIETTLRSVLEQTYGDFEYRIKDGGSTDGTCALIEKYLPLFQKRGISVIYTSEQDKGIYDAMNIAVKSCNGTWVQYMNAGDSFYSPEVLEKTFSQEPDGVFLYGDTVELEDGRAYLWKGNTEELKTRCSICHQSTFVRREWLLAHPFDQRYRIAADYDFFLKSYLARESFVKLDYIVSVFVKDGVSSTNEKERILETEAVKASYGLVDLNSRKYKRVIRMANLKQAVLSNTPLWFSNWLRRVRRKLRHRDCKVQL